MRGLHRAIILLLALVCVAQAASAFTIKTETITPASGPLEPGQQVTAHYTIDYAMLTTTGSNSGDDEEFVFHTELQNPVWKFTIYRDGVAITSFTRGGFAPKVTEFELDYGGNAELDLQFSGTVPSTTTGTVEVIKIEHVRSSNVEDTHVVTRDVVSQADVQNQLTLRENQLADLKANIDQRAADGVDVSAAQAKYTEAAQAIDSAKVAGAAQAATLLATAKTNMDEATTLLDKAWAEKDVGDAAAVISQVDELITYFKDNRSMGSDARVVAIITQRESAVQYYTTASDELGKANYAAARTKAVDAENKATEAYNDATALQKEIGEGFSFNFGSSLLYIGAGIVLVLIVVGAVFVYRKRGKWDELG
ncbi:hypothetical protein FGU65_10860 [Methanoculleus sp. FWC-SCC1]|uniref:Uncharacterized protein n=1 Tax=Methanoculleus frigidifontis TaxID=2584085 RepID=A0ABT8MBU2_9EURY|nr:hypothetical protein [Methanoculleus sp. FWC-SCC1]MDN7025388.1 hypothetical protein [Methanoculleus sp. FWC-SCC1]